MSWLDVMRFNDVLDAKAEAEHELREKLRKKAERK